MNSRSARQSLLRSRRAQQATAVLVAVLMMTTAVLIEPAVVAAKKKDGNRQQTTARVEKAKKKHKAQKNQASLNQQETAPVQYDATQPQPSAYNVAPAVTSTAPMAARREKNPFATQVLTAEGNDSFTYESTNDNGVYMTAPTTNSGINLRQVMWKNTKNGNQSVLNSQTCATWVSESTDMLQEGLALRVFHNDKTGRTKALTLTKNTIFGIHWEFNVLSWDTNRKGDPWVGIKQFNMADIMLNSNGQMKPMPWRVCARADDNKFSFKIWFPDTMNEPSWHNKTYTRSVTIPRQFMIPGKTGWYIGHIPAGGNATYSDLTTKKL